MDDGTAADRAWLAARIRDALARGEGELGIDVTFDGRVVTLHGVVQNQERRRRIEELTRLVARGFSVRSEVTVRPPAPPTVPEALP